MTLGTDENVSVGDGQDRFRFAQSRGDDAIAGFLAEQDRLDFSSINPNLIVPNAPLSGDIVAADSIAWLYRPGQSETIYVNDTGAALTIGSADLSEITLKGVSSGLSGHDFIG